VAKPLDYTEFQELEYEGKYYLYNPYAFGIGAWYIKTSTGKAGQVATKDLQRRLNKKAFGYEVLPNVVDRIKSGTKEQKQRLESTSVEWLNEKINQLKNGGAPQDSYPRSYSELHGNMFFYRYDAKWKDKLPKWDMYPLVIILEIYSNGFLGLNTHYLTGEEKTALVKALLELRSYDESRDIMIIQANYDTLINNIKKYPNFQVCIKRYLTSHIQTRILMMKPHEWGFALYLPLEEFVYNQRKT
jgi:hypothetical protein